MPKLLILLALLKIINAQFLGKDFVSAEPSGPTVAQQAAHLAQQAAQAAVAAQVAPESSAARATQVSVEPFFMAF